MIIIIIIAFLSEVFSCSPVLYYNFWIWNISLQSTGILFLCRETELSFVILCSWIFHSFTNFVDSVFIPMPYCFLICLPSVNLFCYIFSISYFRAHGLVHHLKKGAFFPALLCLSSCHCSPHSYIWVLRLCFHLCPVLAKLRPLLSWYFYSN